MILSNVIFLFLYIIVNPLSFQATGMRRPTSGRKPNTPCGATQTSSISTTCSSTPTRLLIPRNIWARTTSVIIMVAKLKSHVRELSIICKIFRQTSTQCIYLHVYLFNKINAMRGGEKFRKYLSSFFIYISYYVILIIIIAEIERFFLRNKMKSSFLKLSDYNLNFL